MRRKFKLLFNIYISDLKNSVKILKRFVFVLAAALIIGAITGLAGTAFKLCIKYAADFRNNNSFIILFLPAAALFTYALYRIFNQQNSAGTNLVLESVRTQEKISVFTAPLMFVSTVISHLFGASVGCEGAALQIGGGIGQTLARTFKLDQKDAHILTMCGMSGCFAALFGTPVAAAVFVIEVISVGVMYYSALIPCAVSAVTAHMIAHYFGIDSEIIKSPVIINYEPMMFLKVLLLGMGCALVSIIFCRSLRIFSRLSALIKNPYMRAISIGSLGCALIFLFGTDSYAGAGTDVINLALSGTADYSAFIIKILLTSICVSAGLRGGEIIPSFFIGATFGSAFGAFIGVPAGFAAAVGLLGVFCGVTNCPLATLLIALELFGADNSMYFLIAIAVSYFCSGYYGLYSTQKIVYSKYLPEFINIRAK